MAQHTEDHVEQVEDRRQWSPILEDRHRRWVLWSLVDGPEERHLSDLARVIASREAAGERDTDADTDAVAIRLYHVHLPKMDDLGVVSFDTEANVVTLDAPESRVESRLKRPVSPDS